MEQLPLPYFNHYPPVVVSIMDYDPKSFIVKDDTSVKYKINNLRLPTYVLLNFH